MLCCPFAQAKVPDVVIVTDVAPAATVACPICVVPSSSVTTAPATTLFT
jgi:hypothetical protein